MNRSLIHFAEASLDDLDSFISSIGGQIATLDDVSMYLSVILFMALLQEISKAVQHQSVVGKQASKVS